MNASHSSEFQGRLLRAGVLLISAFVATVIAGLIARFLLEAGLSWRCPSMVLLGMPCPGCGTTRAFAALVQFDLLAAFRFNPLIILTLALLMLSPFLKLSWESFERRRGWLFVGTALCLNWIYLLLFLPR